jgi:hypothetical protein
MSAINMLIASLSLILARQICCLKIKKKMSTLSIFRTNCFLKLRLVVDQLLALVVLLRLLRLRRFRRSRRHRFQEIITLMKRKLSMLISRSMTRSRMRKMRMMKMKMMKMRMKTMIKMMIKMMMKMMTMRWMKKKHENRLILEIDFVVFSSSSNF